jgi:DNA-binding response OmpR family regulator
MQTSVRILLADDDRELNGLLAEFLSLEGYRVTSAYDGDEALRVAMGGDVDLVVLDVMMPRMNGIEVLRELRQHTTLPVIMLTARGDPVDRIVGLEIGADDYVPKPCNPRELVARIRAVMRRGQAQAGDEALRVDDLVLYPARRHCELDGDGLGLTGTEFDLLELLMRHAGEVVDKETMSAHALGRRLGVFDRAVDMHVSHLRRKLGARADGRERIKTVRGRGYILVRG